MSQIHDSGNRAGVIATLVLLSWGALVFGGNYPWAYWPMIFVAAMIGLADLVRPDARDGRPAAVIVSFLVLLSAVLLQVVPLPGSVLATVSPAADSLLRQLWLGYALEGAGVQRHALSMAPQQTLTALAFLVSYSLLMFSTSRLTRRALRHLVGGIIGLGAVLALVGIIQKPFFTGKIYGFWEPITRGSSFGPFINRNHFAGWTIMALPLAITFAIACASRRSGAHASSARTRMIWWSTPDASQTLLAGFAATLIAVALLLTFSRSGILSAAVVLVLLFWKVVQRRGRRGVVALTAIGLIVVLGWIGVGPLLDRFADSSTLTVSGRVLAWQQTMAVIRDFPHAGTGLNTYGLVMVVYQTLPGEGHLDAAHSDYLQLVAEGGWLLSLPILIVVGCFVREVRRRFERERTGSGYWIRLGACYGLLAIAIQSAVDFSLQMPGNAALFSVLAGIALHQAGASAE